jgi:hypothetical protein
MDLSPRVSRHLGASRVAGTPRTIDVHVDELVLPPDGDAALLRTQVELAVGRWARDGGWLTAGTRQVIEVQAVDVGDGRVDALKGPR